MADPPGPPDHQARAAEHEAFALIAHEQLLSEWAAVGYFYAAYHTVRQALATDPIFNDWQRLTPHDLNPGDRFTDSHHGLVKNRTRVRWGVNDLVSRLYPPIYAHYIVLHDGSLDVRYRSGLTLPLRDIKASWEFIKTEAANGRLVAP